MLLRVAIYFGLTTSGLGTTGFGTIGTWSTKVAVAICSFHPGIESTLVTRYFDRFTSMRLPTTAPYETADLPLRGPPTSFTVTLAVFRVIVGGPSSGLPDVPFAASTQRSDFSPAYRASAPSALASSSAALGDAARSSRCSTRACHRAAGTERAPRVRSCCMLRGTSRAGRRRSRRHHRRIHHR